MPQVHVVYQYPVHHGFWSGNTVHLFRLVERKGSLVGGAICWLCWVSFSGWAAGARCLFLIVVYLAGDCAIPLSLSGAFRKGFIVAGWDGVAAV